jgi:apolipoprotein N-acyltransferase
MRALLLAAGLGALAVAGFAPLPAHPLVILSLAALFWLARDVTPMRAAALGWAWGLGLFLTGVSWVFVSLSLYGGMPAPVALLATLLFCAFVALYPALALALGARLAPPGWRRLALTLPACWVLLEWLRGWLLTGFPWLALGYAQAPHGPLAGYAPVLGLYGVSLVTALIAGLLAGFAARARGQWPALLLVTALFVGGWAGRQIAWTTPVGERIGVALVQGNIAQDMKFRPDKLDGTLRLYALQVLASDADLVVLPETALPLFRSAVPRDYLELLAEHQRARGGDLLLGLPEDVGEDYYNSVVSLGTSPEGNYRKHHLVPFGEFVPWGFRWLVDMMAIPLGDFATGARDQPPIAAAGQMLAVNVCYEDAFGAERIAAARDSTLLVNVSNDAWFGASLAPRQHLQIGAMRSLEAGRWQLRANNTGITAVLDQWGHVQAELAPFTTGTLHASAQGMTGLTPYLRFGDGPALVLAGLLLAASLWPQRRAAR